VILTALVHSKCRLHVCHRLGRSPKNEKGALWQDGEPEDEGAAGGDALKVL